MQTITPFLWFNNNLAEAAEFYTSTFGTAIITEKRSAAGASIQSVTIQIEGRDLILFNGGPMFQFTPAISFFIERSSKHEIDILWHKLIEGGVALMPLGQYPFSDKFGWVQDKFGLSWQLNFSTAQQSLAPFFLFAKEQHGRAGQAIDFYTSLFPGSQVHSKTQYGAGEGGEEGTTRHAVFSLGGQVFKATDGTGAHTFNFNPAVSLFINCHTQQEVDSLWEKLSAGGAKSRCGWLQDKYGVSWQVVPDTLGKLLNDPDPVKSKRVLNAMLKMDKINIQALQDAYDTQ